MIAVGRMDGAITISPEFAFAKAYTSATIGLPTGDIANYSGEGKPYFGTTSAFGGKLMVIAGGIPVKIGEKLVGGIGVGGSLDVSQDVACAQAAVATLEEK